MDSPPQHFRPNRRIRAGWNILLLLLTGAGFATAREWSFTGIPEPLEAELLTVKNDYVLLRGPEGTGVEVPLASFSSADRKYLLLLTVDDAKKPPLTKPGRPVTRRSNYSNRTAETLEREFASPRAESELHITGSGDPLRGTTVNFTATDGWLFLDRIAPSVVRAGPLPGARARRI